MPMQQVFLEFIPNYNIDLSASKLNDALIACIKLGSVTTGAELTAALSKWLLEKLWPNRVDILMRIVGACRRLYRGIFDSAKEFYLNHGTTDKSLQIYMRKNLFDGKRTKWLQLLESCTIRFGDYLPYPKWLVVLNMSLTSPVLKIWNEPRDIFERKAFVTDQDFIKKQGASSQS